MIDFDNLPPVVNGVKRPERRCEHSIHECMRGKPLEAWHIYIFGTMPEHVETGKGPWAGDLIMAKFDKYGNSHPVLAVGCDGKLHLFTNLSKDIEGIRLDSKGRIVVEN